MLTDSLKNYNNPDSGLAKEQTDWSVKQNREPRNRQSYIESTDLWQREQR